MYVDTDSKMYDDCDERGTLDREGGIVRERDSTTTSFSISLHL